MLSQDQEKAGKRRSANKRRDDTRRETPAINTIGRVRRTGRTNQHQRRQKHAQSGTWLTRNSYGRIPVAGKHPRRDDCDEIRGHDDANHQNRHPRKVGLFCIRKRFHFL